ncbi:MAG: HPr family phosphocarrier protein [Lachnospiraceae bacterium]|nr:HPr family phosphocarrier protein [Lachnospiraceae bacterium]MBR2532996.1 HPr family phosphocarrier protein [Lachnospiraceae bacterium]
MTSRNVVVNLAHDTERAMAELVSLAGEYTSRIHLNCQNKRINAKSIMGVMTLVSYSGDAITVTAEGSDEEEAVEAISTFFAG